MDVTPERLKQELATDKAVTVVDLQSPENYSHSHIPGAVNVPLETFAADYPAVLKDKDEIVVLYGEYDELGKGSSASKILEGVGFTKVGHIVGGLRGWQEAGYPTEGGIES